MTPITKLTKKIETFLWIEECQKAWELIKQKYIETPILLPSNWQVEFHVHIDASLLVVGAMLSQNVTRKSDQPVVYAFRLLKKVEYNYSIIEREALKNPHCTKQVARNIFFVNVNGARFRGTRWCGLFILASTYIGLSHYYMVL